MHPAAMTVYDTGRGCGWRKSGGLYLRGGCGLFSGCGKLPLALVNTSVYSAL
jgi:hypothetical protein